MGEKSVKKARLRVIGGGRVVNPRTGVEDGKGEVQAGSEQYVPLLVSPHTAAGLYHLDPWFSAAVDAISTGVATAEVFPEFQAKSPEEKADSKALQGMAAFLENTPRDQMTVAERLGALDADFSLFGYCAFEVARGSDKMPVAWYHVPGATVRAKKKGGYVQVDGTGKILQRFAPYAAGGNKEGLPELVLIRRYDPTAQYLGSPLVAPLAMTLDRQSAQDAFNRKLLGKGGMPPKIFLLKEELGDESFQRLQAFVEGLAAGDDANQIAVLDGIGEGRLEDMIKDQEDMAFQAGEEAGRQRILAKTHVPPTKVSLNAANFATAYQEDQTFKFEVTQPRLRIYLKRLTAVAREFAPEGYAYGFKQNSLEDFYQLVQALNLLQQTGDLTANQVLQRLGFSGIGEVGDAHIAFTNQGPVKLEDLASGNLPPTPGRLVDTLLQLRRAIEESRMPVKDEG